MKDRWLIGVVIVLAVALGFMLGKSGMVSEAQAQASEGRAGNLICVVGPPSRSYIPIVLVDGLEQRMLVYEYFITGDSLELTAARPFTYDRQMAPYNNTGITVEEVRRGPRF